MPFMKKLILFSAAGLLLGGYASAVRAEPQHISPLPQSCAYISPYGDVCLHAFGGTDVLVPFPDTKGFSCDEVMVQLFHLAPKVETETGKPFSLKGDSCAYVAVTLPPVHDRTVFRVLFSAANSQASRFRENPVLNEELLAAYPQNLWEPLRNWSQSTGLVVVDPLRKLTPLLDQEKIKYSASLPAQKSAPASVCLWVPAGEGAEGFPFSCKSVIVFHEKSLDLPSIERTKESGRLRVDVNMKLLDLLRDNPLVQQTFISLVESALGG
jgi:hypothetical protein